MRLIAVREAGVSQSQGGSQMGPLMRPEHHSTVTYGGFQGGPQLGPPDAERRQSLGQL